MTTGREYRLSILVTGKDSGASSMLGGLGGSVSSLWKVIGGLVSAAVLIKAGQQIFEFGKESVLAAARVDELKMVNQVLAKNAGLTSAAVEDAALAVKHMGIEAAVSQQVVAKFVQNQLDLTKASELARVAQDAAVISGQNSTQALDGLMQGLITLQPEVLRTYGLFVDTQKVYEKLAKTLRVGTDELTTQQKQEALLNEILLKGIDIQGAYEAAMLSASKQMRSWPRYIDDIKVAFGKLFDNQFKEGVFATSDFLKDVGVFFETVDKALNPPPQARDNDWADRTIGKYKDVETASVSSLEAIQMAVYKAFGPETSRVFTVFTNKMSSDLSELISTLSDLWDKIKIGDVSGLLQGALAGLSNIDWKKIASDIITGAQSIDWGGILEAIYTEAGETFDVITAFFDDIDWGQVSSDLIDLLELIDWAGIGDNILMMAKAGFANAQKGFSFIGDVLYDIITETDWGGLAIALGEGLWEMILHAVGSSTEEWKASGYQMGLNIRDGLLEIKKDMETAIYQISHSTLAKALAFAGQFLLAGARWVANIVTGLVLGGASITFSIDGWRQGVEDALRRIAKVFYERVVGWIGQAVQGFNSAKSNLISAIGSLIEEVKAAIIPIVIPISWGNPGTAPIGSSSGGSTNNGLGTSGGSNKPQKPTCFTGDTPVLLATGRLKPIRDIRKGDRVRSYDLDAGHIVMATVTETFQHEQDDVKRLLLVNGFLKVTPEHLVWEATTHAWMPAGDLQLGHAMVDPNGQWVVIVSIETLPFVEPVYNLHTDRDTHNYFAGGLLVHNAKANEGFAGGGVAVGPLSGYRALLHGIEAVIPLANGSVPVRLQMSGGYELGGGGGTSIFVNLNWNPFVSTGDRTEAQEKLAPYIADGVRSELARRGIK